MTEPTDQQIADVLARTNDPRELAIAYLRATQRAKRAERALKASEAARDQMRAAKRADDFVSDLFGLGRGRRG